MYLGLMKRGVSYMIAFFGWLVCGILVGNLLGLWAIVGLGLPIIWFAAFFDFWRYPRMDEAERGAVQDEFLLPENMKLPKQSIMRKIRVVAGIVLIYAGLHSFYSMYVREWLWSIEYEQFNNIHRLISNVPAIINALVIIAVGLVLILWKAKQVKREAVKSDEE